MGAADATQGRIAEIFVTAGKRTDLGTPSGTGLALRDANWTSVENMIKTQVGQAITGNPAQVLGVIQQTSSSGS
jgi:hypothetical protein